MARIEGRCAGGLGWFWSRPSLCLATRRTTAERKAKTRLEFLRATLRRRKPETQHRQPPSYAAASRRGQENKGPTTARRTLRADFSTRKSTPLMPREPDGSRR